MSCVQINLSRDSFGFRDSKYGHHLPKQPGRKSRSCCDKRESLPMTLLAFVRRNSIPAKRARAGGHLKGRDDARHGRPAILYPHGCAGARAYGSPAGFIAAEKNAAMKPAAPRRRKFKHLKQRRQTGMHRRCRLAPKKRWDVNTHT